MEENRFLSIGKVVGVHGIKGNIKIYSFSESVSLFTQGKRIIVKKSNGSEKTYEIEWAKPHQRLILLSLAGVADRNQAELLIRSELLIEKTDLPELEEGTWYQSDIIGLDVFTIDDTYIGQITSIISTGSNDVYVVKDPNESSNKEILIPALESVVIAVDLAKKKVKVDLPEGLLR